MIEIEKNFYLKPDDKKRLTDGAEFVSERCFTDVYYDTNAYDLTARDFWLRQRDNRFELKVPLNVKGVDRNTTDQYRELETDAEIIKELNLPAVADVSLALRDAGYRPFATITTKREHWRKGEFNLDFDVVEDLRYATFEVELMIDTPEAIPEAETRILDFAHKHGVFTSGRGKVIEYLLKHNPDHYKVLKASGVIRD